MCEEVKALAELFVEETYNDSAISIDQKYIDGESILVFRNNILKIGRSDDNTVTINHPSISSIHCIIWSVQFDDESIPLVYLKDVSLNGTFINGQKMIKNQIYLLNNYDILSIDYGISLKYASIYGENESLVGNCLIEDNNICTDFSNWIVKNRVLGNGTFGYVFVSERKHDSKLCAVKVIRNSVNFMPFEAKILLKLDHPNIIKVYETEAIGKQFYIFEDLVCGGDLFSYLTNGNCLQSIPEFEALVITYQVLNALQYLHQNNVVHRDLKLDNILLETSQPFTRIVLADFGIAKPICSTKKRMFTTVGTPEYCAPEVGFEFTKIPDHLKTGILGTYENETRKGYDFKCDIWSLGIITHIMLSGISPFYEDGTEINIIKSAKRGKLNFKSAQWKLISREAKDFVESVLQVDTITRLSADDSLEHKWIKSHQNDLIKIYRKILNQSSIDHSTAKQLMITLDK